MKTTLLLKNAGDAADPVHLQISYFVKSTTGETLETQQFELSVKPGREESKTVDFGAAALKEREVLISVEKPKGNILLQANFPLRQLEGARQQLEFAANADAVPDDAPDAFPAFLTGRLIDRKGARDMENVQILLSVKKQDAADFEPYTTITTEAQGYFAIEYPPLYLEEANATIGLNLVQNPISIKLETRHVAGNDDQGNLVDLPVHVLPRRVILVADIQELTTEIAPAVDCGCHASTFEDKKVLEEFSFFSLVRTSQPEIKGYVLEEEEEISLADVLRRLPFGIFELLEPIKAMPFVTRDLPFKALTARAGTAASRAARTDADLIESIKSVKINKSVLHQFLQTEKALTPANLPQLFQQNDAFQLQQALNPPLAAPRPLGRVELDGAHAVDWDEDPTIYQAVSVAHGHLLQFKTEWIADGYSLGDLLYSLPLAPGQKKQIVVFDWERRESASNVQSIDYEENLYNSLARDRDIYEIATGTVQENTQGGSKASVAAIAGGIGGYVGVLFGVAGGASRASSTAWQNNLRQMSATDQQKLRDRIVQSANAVRSMRSTVLQTVSQGERFEVASESVANYNHCHAITIQYYEVLRHFKIRQRFADAREVLFVPLLMTTFDKMGKKALRWREQLTEGLLDRRLRPAFDAAERIADQWQDSGFPSGTYASESIVNASGVLSIRFVLQRPLDQMEEVDDHERPPVFAGNGNFPPVWHKKKVSKIIPANWEKLKPFLDGISPEEFHKDYLENAADKDAVFHQILGERIARAFINSLVFSVDNEQGTGIGTLPVDVSVTSRYVRNGVLKVTLRLNQPTAFARDQFHYLRIRCRELNISLLGINFTINFGNVLPEGSYMTIESGFMRYRTKHFDGFLFRYQNLGDDLTSNDGAMIYAGPTTEELKDPRKEDLALLNRLIAHLNDNLEHYHKAIWRRMSAERRFMLLDGVRLNGKGEGKSVASLVENELLTIVGNSLVFPVAPGLNLNPDFGQKESLREFYMTAATEPISVSVPTKGVFAEAVMGKCNSCEKIDESRFWRWEESPIPDSPTAIAPINTDTRRQDPGNLQPQALPNPVVNIQNAPGAPDPSGLAATIGLLGQGFKDITGLEGNQRNAIQAFQSSMEAAKSMANQATNLEVQKNMERRLDRTMNAIENDPSLTPEKKAELKEKAINAYMGAGAGKPEEKQTPKPTLTDAARQAVQDGKTVEAKSSDAASGKTEELKVSGQKDSLEVATPEVRIDLAKLNSPLKRTFFPDQLDKSGVIEVEGVVFDEPQGTTYRWSFGNPDSGKILTPNSKKTKILAGMPGIGRLDFEVLDAAGKTLKPGKTPMHIGVPQFFVIIDSYYNYSNPFVGDGRTVNNATSFDAALTMLNLLADKATVVTKIKEYTESRLIRKTGATGLEGHNLRLLWKIGTFAEPIPVNLINPKNAPLAGLKDTDGYCTYISVSGYPQPGNLMFGATMPNQDVPTVPPGPRNFFENIFIFTGAFELLTTLQPPANALEKDLFEKISKLVQARIAQPNDAPLKALMIETFARLYADVICHEIYHSVTFHSYNSNMEVADSGFDTQGHTIPVVSNDNDIMNAQRNFKERTAIDVTDMANFPKPGSFTLLPFAQNSILIGDAKDRVDLFFPLPPVPPFDK